MKFTSFMGIVCLFTVLAACGGGAGGGGGGAVQKSDPQPGATAVGVAIWRPSTVSIGAEGGMLSSPDGRLTVTIPAGAVAEPTTFSIQPISNFAHGNIGMGYRLAPEGLVLTKPTTLTFTYADADLLGTAPTMLGAASQSADGLWRWSGGTIDTVAHTISVPVSHFSDWSLVSNFRLSYIASNVPLAGTQVITGQYCYGPSSASASLYSPEVGYRCDLTSDDLAKLRAVGPVAHWTLTVGTITAVDDSGVMICVFPEDVLTQPPVVVAVDADDAAEHPFRLEGRVQLDPPTQANPPHSWGIFGGSIEFSSDEIDIDNGGAGRAYKGSVVAYLNREDSLHYRGRAVANIKVDFHFPGQTCDSISVPVETDILLTFESASFSLPQMGATGSYSAETRCCSADGLCQRQDVSSAISVPFLCPVDHLPNVSYGPTNFEFGGIVQCTIPGSKLKSDATGQFYGGEPGWKF
jgi:hypothetical protein